MYSKLFTNLLRLTAVWNLHQAGIIHLTGSFIYQHIWCIYLLPWV